MSIDALSSYTLSDWQRVAARELAAAETRLFIDGEFRDAVAGGRFESTNPANREVIAAMAAADEKDVDAAVASARKAFRNGFWSGMAPRERMQVLYRYAQLI